MTPLPLLSKYISNPVCWSVDGLEDNFKSFSVAMSNWVCCFFRPKVANVYSTLSAFLAINSMRALLYSTFMGSCWPLRVILAKKAFCSCGLISVKWVNLAKSGISIMTMPNLSTNNNVSCFVPLTAISPCHSPSSWGKTIFSNPVICCIAFATTWSFSCIVFVGITLTNSGLTSWGNLTRLGLGALSFSFCWNRIFELLGGRSSPVDVSPPHAMSCADIKTKRILDIAFIICLSGTRYIHLYIFLWKLQ